MAERLTYSMREVAVGELLATLDQATRQLMLLRPAVEPDGAASLGLASAARRVAEARRAGELARAALTEPDTADSVASVTIAGFSGRQARARCLQRFARFALLRWTDTGKGGREVVRSCWFDLDRGESLDGKSWRVLELEEGGRHG